MWNCTSADFCCKVRLQELRRADCCFGFGMKFRWSRWWDWVGINEVVVGVAGIVDVLCSAFLRSERFAGGFIICSSVQRDLRCVLSLSLRKFTPSYLAATDDLKLDRSDCT
jgi:hypothetical protein